MNEFWADVIESAFTFGGVLVSVLAANKKLHKKVDQLMANDRDQNLNILRLTVMNSEMPISERIIAGDKYVKAGGNGEVKKYYHELLVEHTK